MEDILPLCHVNHVMAVTAPRLRYVYLGRELLRADQPQGS